MAFDVLVFPWAPLGAEANDGDLRSPRLVGAQVKVYEIVEGLVGQEPTTLVGQTTTTLTMQNG